MPHRRMARLQENLKQARSKLQPPEPALACFDYDHCLGIRFPGRMLVSQCPEYGFDKAWLASKEHFWGDFFEAYGSMYLDLVAMITPYHAD